MSTECLKGTGCLSGESAQVYSRGLCRRDYLAAKRDGSLDQYPRPGRRPKRRPTHCKNGHEYTPENTRKRTNPRSGREDWACRACLNAAMRSWNKTPGGQLAKERKRARQYGLTVEELRAIEATGCCAICGAAEAQSGAKLHIDHCHVSGKARGLLCHGCNGGLGLFQDDTERLMRAIEYLQAARGTA